MRYIKLFESMDPKWHSILDDQMDNTKSHPIDVTDTILDMMIYYIDEGVNIDVDLILLNKISPNNSPNLYSTISKEYKYYGNSDTTINKIINKLSFSYKVSMNVGENINLSECSEELYRRLSIAYKTESIYIEISTENYLGELLKYKTLFLDKDNPDFRVPDGHRISSFTWIFDIK